MLIPPKYSLTPNIIQLLSSIEGSREVVDAIAVPPAIENNIRRQSSLKTSLYSARIEGNELTLEELSRGPSKTQQKAEVFNTLKALNWMLGRSKKDISEKEILELHEILMKGLIEIDNLGKWRQEMSATFNKAGIAIYLHPSPRYIESQIKKLIAFVNSEKEQFIPIRAALAHYIFEKIHPFLDGNGRMGRLLLQRVLAQGGYGMKGLLPIEEYIDNHRLDYYHSLEEPEKDVTDYVLFILNAINETALKTKEAVISKQQAEATDYLLPRRAEIYRIVKEQKLVNFDQIRRRFSKVNERTLRYDLKKLQDSGLIRKLGTTKGVYYQPAQ